VKFNNLINAIISIIPDEIDIPGTDIYFEGGINQALKIKKDEYIILPFDLSIQNSKFPYRKNNTAVFGDFVQNDYQIQSFMSDYFIESGVWAFYYAGLLNVPPISVPLSTTEIDIALLGKLTRNGFALGMPCKVGM